MNRAKSKEECRKLIIKQATKWFREKRTIYVIGQKRVDVDYIYSLLMDSSLKHCKFLKGGGEKFPKRLGHGADYVVTGIYFWNTIR